MTEEALELMRNYAWPGNIRELQNCIERGADIAYLSVYEHEAEVLYPPLTFLRLKGVQEEDIAGVKMLVVNGHAQIVGN